MKKNSCFFIAFIAGIVAFSFGSLSIRFMQDQTRMMLCGSLSLFILQLLPALKYSATTLMLLPSETNFKQLALGFFTADITVGLWISTHGDMEVFPGYLLFMQISLIALNHKTKSLINSNEVSLDCDDIGTIALKGI